MQIWKTQKRALVRNEFLFPLFSGGHRNDLLMTSPACHVYLTGYSRRRRKHWRRARAREPLCYTPSLSLVSRGECSPPLLLFSLSAIFVDSSFCSIEAEPVYSLPSSRVSKEPVISPRRRMSGRSVCQLLTRMDTARPATFPGHPGGVISLPPFSIVPLFPPILRTLAGFHPSLHVFCVIFLLLPIYVPLFPCSPGYSHFSRHFPSSPLLYILHSAI